MYIRLELYNIAKWEIGSQPNQGFAAITYCFNVHTASSIQGESGNYII